MSIFTIFFILVFSFSTPLNSLGGSRNTIISDTLAPGFKNKIYTRVDVEATFPGGHQAWSQYVKNFLNDNIRALIEDRNNGTCNLKFVVNEDGNISDIEVITMKNTALSKLSIAALRNSVKWVPATIDGVIVKSYRMLPITFNTVLFNY